MKWKAVYNQIFMKKPEMPTVLIANVVKRIISETKWTFFRFVVGVYCIVVHRNVF